jgi:hypothetical protein
MPTWVGSQRSMPIRASSIELNGAPPVGYLRIANCTVAYMLPSPVSHRSCAAYWAPIGHAA